jgi:hypothetical protein
MIVAAIALLNLVPAMARADVPVTLRGSPASMVRQNTVAKGQDYTFARSSADVRRLVELGRLVPLEGDANYTVSEGVSHAVARPELRTFVERLGAQYRAATGEKLVVTSLTRAASEQPGNSHPLSVHPTGMAVDLRVSQQAASRQWLEETLLSLERRGLLDVTREARPPHYHVAVFPEAYAAYAADLAAKEQAAATAAAEAEARAVAEAATAGATPAVANGFVAAPATSAASEAARTGHPLPWATLVAVPFALLAYGVLRRRPARASRD